MDDLIGRAVTEIGFVNDLLSTANAQPYARKVPGIDALPKPLIKI
ncbi:hypothetical protein GCM10011273_34480 [Asticcacaulis endophyticus]|uniref:Uncharacterized protein n=1 Tax=Asticcacaulis endophyticus TaxID=1395890 RepID=A0A918QGM4_9CAUL|nr:hypothetical protein GCM10011273_34480 [Asticcacaulis endophyticus]